VLAFTPDGTRLLAVGDDKVVRRWIVTETGFSSRKLAPLRWPIFREQRGSIFALALSPDADADKVAIAGWGTRTGLVMVLNRYNGNVLHSLKNVPSRHVNWAIAFSPTGKYVVYGNDVGELFRWDIGSDAPGAVPFKGAGSKKGRNRVRLISFRNARRFLSVAQDGKVHEWDLTRPDQAPTLLATFSLPSLRYVAISPEGRWLAASGENREGDTVDVKRVELLDLGKTKGQKGSRRFLNVPQGPNGKSFRYPLALAFDGSKGQSSKRLAVGVKVTPDQSPDHVFFKETGGHISLYDLVANRWLDESLDIGYRPDVVVFRPVPAGAKWPNQLATAGGNNHEVRLWDLSRPKRLLGEVRTPGSCLWGVALSQPNKPGDKARYLAWKEQRAANPATPNRWGAGQWRVFDVQKRTILPRPPRDFKPVLPLSSYAQPGQKEPWRVETTRSGYVWRITGPGTSVDLDAESGLYDPGFNNPPRCYTFIKESTQGKVKKPVRLAVGHTWGISVYDCRPGNKVTLARVMLGHEGEVMAVAPSHDGTLLVSASRDQTLASWSLVDWPTQAELGASFRSENGKLVVREVSLGSPAWEAINPLNGGEDDTCRLAEEDEIDMVLIAAERFLYDPRNRSREEAMRRHFPGIERMKRGSLEQTLAKLQGARANQQYIFVKRVDGKDVFKSTTVRQRPLWRFFPERQPGKDWVMWRYRDFYYDTNSARADTYVGWQVNRGPNDKPDFFPLERFGSPDAENARGENVGLLQPKKVWAFFDQALQQPEKVIFPDIQPPDVRLDVVTRPDKTNDLVVRISIRPLDNKAGQRLGRVVNLWINDYKYRPPAALKPDARGVIEARVTIPRSELRYGRNALTLQAYNVEGGRGQATAVVDYTSGPRPVSVLRALCVGINDYSRVKGYSFADLRCSKNDAEEMKDVLAQHNGSKLYQKAEATLIPQEKATASTILAALSKLAKGARPDDWLVVFLSGHGYAKMKSGDDYEPGSFFYLCTDTDRKKPATQLSSKLLYEALAGIKCAKMLILDCCHSGDVASNPLRDLSREGVPFLILSSCKNDQSALEPKNPGKGEHGLFTQCLLEAIGDARAGQGRRFYPISGNQIRTAIVRRLPELLQKYNADPEDQVPEFLLPDRDARREVLCRP
jgi:WD40 repeat protein